MIYRDVLKWVLNENLQKKISKIIYQKKIFVKNQKIIKKTKKNKTKKETMTIFIF